MEKTKRKNMRKSIKNNEKGITLVALVVTIVVLLILAGVSLNLVLSNNGIANKAKEARNKTKEAKYNEETEMNTVPDWIDKQLSENNDDTNAIKTVKDLKAGEKVNYVDKNGTARECIVLYDEEYNKENKTNYGIQVITTEIVDTITLGMEKNFDKSKDDYNGALEILQKKAEEYLNLTYASGARCVGSKPDDPYWDTDEVAGDLYLKVGDINYETDCSQMKILNIETLKDDYYLASRDDAEGFVTYAFEVRICRSSGEINSGLILLKTPTGVIEAHESSSGFRPVFILKPSTKIIDGDGIAIPYTLENKN